MNAAKKILFATDYSDLDDRALTYAASLARGMEATLLVVHVSQLGVIRRVKTSHGSAGWTSGVVRLNNRSV